MRTQRRWWAGPAAAALALALVALTALPAAAGIGPRGGDRNRRIAVGDITVSAGEVVDGPLLVIDGRARIDGRVDGAAFVLRGNLVVTADGAVDGDVVVARGDAIVDGVVDGNVVVIGGRARIGPNAVVRGDVRSTDAPRVARSARVTGDVQDVNVAGIIAALGAGILVFWWIAVTVSTALLGVLLLALVPRGLESASEVGRDRNGWWQALLVGIGLMVGLPVLGLFAVSTLLGLPFGLGLLGAMGLLHALGYVMGAYFLGRLILPAPRNRFGAFFTGWAILRIVAIVPLLGLLVWFATTLYGLGMLAVAGFRVGHISHAAPKDAPTETPTPPTDAPAPTTPEVTAATADAPTTTTTTPEVTT